MGARAVGSVAGQSREGAVVLGGHFCTKRTNGLEAS
jgi:hypothetical protein